MSGQDLFDFTPPPEQSEGQAIQVNLQHSAMQIASDPNTSAGVLEALARVCSSVVLECIAVNPSTTSAILEVISRHPEPTVRASLADNKNAPLSCLLRLATDEDLDVRFQLAESHHLPIEVLKVLSEDENPYVSWRAERTLDRVLQCQETAMVTWREYRKAELDKRMTEIRSLSEGTPFTFLTKLLSSIYRHARAM